MSRYDGRGGYVGNIGISSMCLSDHFYRAPDAYMRCEYCGRDQKTPDDGQCRGCGAPLRIVALGNSRMRW